MTEAPKPQSPNDAPDAASPKPETKETRKNPEDMTSEEMIAEIKKQRENEGNQEGKEKTIDSPEGLGESFKELMEAIVKLLQEKFFPKKNEDGSVSVPEADSLVGNAGNDETETTTTAPDGKEKPKEAPKVKSNLADRVRDTAANRARDSRHAPPKLHPPASGDIRSFYEKGPDGKMMLVRKKFDSSKGKFGEPIESKSVDQIRKELTERRKKREDEYTAKREAQKLQELDGNGTLARAQSKLYGSYFRKRSNERFVNNLMNEGDAGDAWREREKKQEQVDAGTPLPIDEMPSYSNYRVGRSEKDIKREADQRVEAMVQKKLTNKELKDIAEKNNLFTEDSFKTYARQQWQKEVQADVSSGKIKDEYSALTFDQMEAVSPMYDASFGEATMGDTERFVKAHSLGKYVVDKKNHNVVMYNERGSAAIFLDAQGKEIGRIENGKPEEMTRDALKGKLFEYDPTLQSIDEKIQGLVSEEDTKEGKEGKA